MALAFWILDAMDCNEDQEKCLAMVEPKELKDFQSNERYSQNCQSSSDQMKHINEIANEVLRNLPTMSDKQTQAINRVLTIQPLNLRPVNDVMDNKYLKKFLQPMIRCDMSDVSKTEVSSLQILSWKRRAMRKGDIVAKFLFITRKIVWEILRNGVKYTIQIQWDNILSMRVSIEEDKPGILELELSQSPLCLQDLENPPSRRHNLENISMDFTGNRASTFRIHKLEFPPGILDPHIRKLIRCNDRFSVMIRSRFPSLICPFFDVNNNHIGRFGRNESSINPTRHSIPRQNGVFTFSGSRVVSYLVDLDEPQINNDHVQAQSSPHDNQQAIHGEFLALAATSHPGPINLKAKANTHIKEM